MDNTIYMRKGDAYKYVINQRKDGRWVVDYYKLIPGPDFRETSYYYFDECLYYYASERGTKEITDPDILGKIIVSKEKDVIRDWYLEKDEQIYGTDGKNGEGKSRKEYFDELYILGKNAVENKRDFGYFSMKDWALENIGCFFRPYDYGFNSDREEYDIEGLEGKSDDDEIIIKYKTWGGTPQKWLELLASKCDFRFDESDPKKWHARPIMFKAVNKEITRGEKYKVKYSRGSALKEVSSEEEYFDTKEEVFDYIIKKYTKYKYLYTPVDSWINLSPGYLFMILDKENYYFDEMTIISFKVWDNDTEEKEDISQIEGYIRQINTESYRVPAKRIPAWEEKLRIVNEMNAKKSHPLEKYEEEAEILKDALNIEKYGTLNIV